MMDIVKAIYDMMGKYTYPVLKEDAPRQHVEVFFQVLDFWWSFLNTWAIHSYTLRLIPPTLLFPTVHPKTNSSSNLILQCLLNSWVWAILFDLAQPFAMGYYPSSECGASACITAIWCFSSQLPIKTDSSNMVRQWRNKWCNMSRGCCMRIRKVQVEMTSEVLQIPEWTSP